MNTKFREQYVHVERQNNFKPVNDCVYRTIACYHVDRADEQKAMENT